MHRHQRAEDRAEVKRTIETAIAQYVQPLNTIIAQERTSRVQAISEIQQQIKSLQAEVHTISANTVPNRPREGRSDEVVIGGFGLKSKEGAIEMIEKIIMDKDGDPQIFKDKVSYVSKVVPIKFQSNEYAEVFVRQHGRKTNFSYRFQNF